jgi:hypothetical protein
MRWPSMPFGDAAARIGLAGTGTAGFVGSLAIVHNPWAAVAAAGIAIAPLITNATAKIIESRHRHRPAIIRAQAELEEARSEAAALIERTETLAKLLEAGLASGTTEQAAIMALLQSLNADLPKDKHLHDEARSKHLAALAKLLAESNPKPRSPGRGPDNDPAANVVPFRRRQGRS